MSMRPSIDESVVGNAHPGVIFLPEPPRELIEIIAIATVIAVVYWRRASRP